MNIINSSAGYRNKESEVLKHTCQLTLMVLDGETSFDLVLKNLLTDTFTCKSFLQYRVSE